ncbi:hypothetical protein RSAG8_05915, partial [Rhizoctonia solani AG-8 WAC10335]
MSFNPTSCKPNVPPFAHVEWHPIASSIHVIQSNFLQTERPGTPWWSQASAT